MEIVMINGEPVEVPEPVRALSLQKDGPGRAAIEEWFAKEDAPHAKVALEKSGLKAAEVVCTGFKGAMLTSDVQRAVIARAEAEKAKAAKTPAPAASAPTPTDAASKEG